MGFFSRLFGGGKALSATPAAPAPVQPPAPRSQTPQERSAEYQAEKAVASAQGKTAYQVRNGWLSSADARAALESLRNARVDASDFRIRVKGAGVGVVLPDGTVIDAVSNVGLRHWNVYVTPLAGASHYRANPPSTHMARVLLKREPNNEFDASAVAVTTMRGATLGYVKKGKARWLAVDMDGGMAFEARMVKEGHTVVIAPAKVWATLGKS